MGGGGVGAYTVSGYKVVGNCLRVCVCLCVGGEEEEGRIELTNMGFGFGHHAAIIGTARSLLTHLLHFSLWLFSLWLFSLLSFPVLLFNGDCQLS